MILFEKYNRTNQLQVSLTEILKKCCEKVYYRKAASKEVYPYITFYLKHTKTENVHSYFFEVHVWDNNISSAELLADTLEDMDSCSYMNEYHSFDLTLESRNNIEDEDKGRQHIVLLFSLTYFSKKG